MSKTNQISRHINKFEYKHQDITNGFRVVFSASLSLIDRICQETTLFLQTHAIEKTILQDIDLGLREALSNAIRHGAKGIHQSVIHYQIICDQQLLLTITVTDPGVGFDWATTMQRTLPSLAESGRGLPILQNSFDTIQFNERGNELTLVKSILSKGENIL